MDGYNPNDDEEPTEEDIIEYLRQYLGQPVEVKTVQEVIEESPYSLVGGKPIHPEAIPPVHDYEVTLTFSSRDNRDKVEAFMEAVVAELPNGARSKITTTGEVLSVDELTWDHVKSRIRVTVQGRVVEGTLDAIYNSGVGSGISKTLIIDGKAWVLSFGVVELNV